MSLGYLDMGLLSHAEQLLAVKLASQPAVFYSTQHKINDFHSFAEKVGVKRACILVPYGKRFFMQYEHGFDAISIFKSVSSTDIVPSKDARVSSSIILLILMFKVEL